MITTEFLSGTQYCKYTDWLQAQDKETLQLYFGSGAQEGLIDHVVCQIDMCPENHRILVAKQNGEWAGTIHLALNYPTVEFGVIVRQDLREQGIASLMMDEALVWSRNRGYTELFMHCLAYNSAIRRLCSKHGLKTRSMFGESEVEMQLPPANILTLAKESAIKQRNFYTTVAEIVQNFYKKVYG